jgi:hypothetical protein
MKSSKLSTLLSTFNGHEFLLFKKFIASPYFNSKREIITFFEHLHSNLKKNKNLGTKEEAFEIVFPGEEYNSEKIIRLTSELVGLVQQFFTTQEIRYNDFTCKKLYIEALSKRNLSKLFFSESKKLVTQLEASPNQNIHTQLDLHLLIKEMHFYHDKLVSSKDLPRLIKAQKKLDTFYLLSKLKISCETICLQNTFNEHFEIPLLENVKQLAEQWSHENNLFPLYLQTLKNIQFSVDQESFENLKVLFFQNLSLLSQNEQLSILLLILNINGMKINYGKSQDIIGQFDLYKKGLENNILIVNNRMTPESYTNVVVLAIHLEEFNWAEKFMKKYATYLSNNIREACITFCKGNIAFKKGAYDETIRLLWNCKFDQLSFDIRTKSITVRALAELFYEHPDKYEYCLGQILTIEKYIRRRKDLSETKSNAYLNFIKAAKKIMNLKWKNKFNDAEIHKLKERVSTESNIIGKTWLLQKLN